MVLTPLPQASDDQSPRTQFHLGSQNGKIGLGLTCDASTAASADAPTGGWFVHSTVLNGENSTLFQNGQPLNKHGTPVNSIATGDDIAWVGNTPGSISTNNGVSHVAYDIAELLVYAKALTDKERAQVMRLVSAS